MKKVCVVGSGQLGSRHLQGLLRSSIISTIYVIDVAEASLSLARERVADIRHTHQIVFTSLWSDIPNQLDAAIIATNSNVREEVVYRLLECRSVQFLILEKVLFQTIDSFQRIKTLIDQERTQAWVNHPRRMFNHYKKIKREIVNDQSPKMYCVVGGNWGLGCNGLHFLDLFTFLEGSDIQRIDTAFLDNVLLESKRSGFIEFSGTLSGTFNNGGKFSITSHPGAPSTITVFIASSTSRWLIQEGGAFFTQYFSQANNFQIETETYTLEYQSTLTTTLIENLLLTGTCELPTYEEASKTHIPFIEALLQKYNEIKGENIKICPIT